MDFTFLNDIYTCELVYTRRQFIAVFSVKYFNIKNDSAAAVRYTK